MSTEEYYQMIISVLIGLTMITLILLFLYTVYGKEEQASATGTRFLDLSGRLLSFDRLIVYFLLRFP